MLEAFLAEASSLFEQVEAVLVVVAGQSVAVVFVVVAVQSVAPEHLVAAVH